AALFTGLALVAPVLWLVRNATSDAPDIMGQRVPSGLGPLRLIRRTAQALGELTIARIGQNPAVLIGIVIGVLVLGVVAAIVRSAPGSASHRLLPVVLVIVWYVGFAVA